MKFSCYKDDLRDALKAVMPAVAVKPQTPILSGVYVKAEDSAIEIHGNNYAIGVIAKIPASIEESGEVVVSGKKFQEFVANLSARTISCDVEDNVLHISSDGANVTLLTMPAEDSPKVKVIESADTFAVRQSVLHDLIRKTSFAASNDKGARPVFTGVNFDFHDGYLSCVATNTHRLAIAKIPFTCDRESFNFVVPAAALNNVLARINPKDHEDNVTVSFTGRYVAFTVDNIFMTVRLREGQFPSIDRIIPTDSTTRVTVNVAEFKEALGIVGLMAKETEYNTAKLFVAADSIEITARSAEVGDAVKSVEATIEGNDLEIAFNVSYLADVLRVVDSEKINIAFNGQYSPAAVTMPGDDDFIYVVTPVRV